ncbi:protein of unknown function [Streptococcus thermophilus]|uniref:Uncharacterized protein n=1 Tax=Streptococcus thermophilus TaxID=1308 RepID=A0A8D6XR22_STRTR|nr:protein of unknown function [Streptococcus thermophilus]CAD0142358.1 protein of unknown function [Streptococcus thermophilus]CAD0144873.1 protein of unknown function [Streptococcus thermophilus]CAD0152217.1 protein of unknown function [Streptococcus thermophilus]
MKLTSNSGNKKYIDKSLTVEGKYS